jgi:YfiH family protein
MSWIVPAWRAPARVVAVSTTRDDDGDEEARLARILGAAPVQLDQVHGVDVVVVDRAGRAAALRARPRADAAVAREPGVAVAVRAADCLPVLFADRRGSVVAAAHAGWRGLAAGVLEATLAAMDVAPAEIVAWIGPAIGPRRFEVGRDVYDAFVGAEDADAVAFAPHREDKWLADLPALARRRLARAGVRDVAGGTWCTYEDPARFHSWRRDRASGRMITAVAIVDGAPPYTRRSSPDARDL